MTRLDDYADENYIQILNINEILRRLDDYAKWKLHSDTYKIVTVKESSERIKEGFFRDKERSQQ